MRLHLASGAGNDFLAAVEPDADPAPELIRAWCRRGLSLGADGLFVLRRPGGGDETALVRMTHYNADGSPAELCVNGTRCAARLAFSLGWAEGEVVVDTGAGPIWARDAGGGRVTLSVAAAEAPEKVAVAVDGETVAGYRVTVGVPHFVVPWSGGMADAPLARLGPPLRRHPAFGTAGANVSWVRWVGRDRFELRTWERGVEAETLACGSGVLAALAVGLAADEIDLPVVVRTAGGVELEVAQGEGGSWDLTGEARLLGVVEVGEEAAGGPEGKVEWAD